MTYEGTEKRLEIVVSDKIQSLRTFSHDFWNNIVEKAGASIITEMANDFCDSYVLSESSLFVFDHKFIMITCGKTDLACSALAFIDEISIGNIRFFALKRKHENFPELQPYSFADDCKRLQQRLKGNITFIGEQANPLVSVYSMYNDYYPEKHEKNIEIIMRDLSDEILKDLHSGEFNFTFLQEFFPDFAIDHHSFNPTGYSFNALYKDFYFTAHITPEQPGSYVSFETNYTFSPDYIMDLILCLLQNFKPKSVDYISLGIPGFTEHFGNHSCFQRYNIVNTAKADIYPGMSIMVNQFELLTMVPK